MADKVYFKGWEGAKLSYKSGGSFIPIACITSRSESNATNVTEKVNVCTQGKTITTAKSISRTVSLSGEVVDSDSLDDLRTLQDDLLEHTFMVYRGTGTTTPIYFNGIITNLAADYSAGQDEDATFSMDVTINGDYLTVDPNL